MANFDYRIENTDTQVFIKVATFAHGTVNLVLNKSELSQEEQSAFELYLAEQGFDESQIVDAIANEVKARQQHIAIVSSIDQNGIDEVVNLIGTNPSGWYETYCNNHAIFL